MEKVLPGLRGFIVLSTGERRGQARNERLLRSVDEFLAEIESSLDEHSCRALARWTTG